MSDVMIEAKGLGKKYGNFVALQNANFELRRGEILGFLGPNGAGKSTTMKILTCFIAPTSGTAAVNGCDLWDDPLGVRKAIGYLPESNALYTEMLVLEYLEWAAQMRGLEGPEAQKRIFKIIEQVALGDVIAKSIKELSKGYKQRVGLAQALIHEPPILILDEPLSGLDPNQAAEIRDLIREIGKERTILFSTHNLDEVTKTCQRVLIIDKGKIVADDTPEALAKSSGGPRYKVTILKGKHLEQSNGSPKVASYRDSAKAPSPEQVFRRMKGVESVRELSKKGDEIKVELVSSVDDDLRAEIFRAAVESGLILVGLEAQTQNLEQVFRDLTRAGGATPSARTDDDLDDDLDDDEEYEDEAPAEEEE